MAGLSRPHPDGYGYRRFYDYGEWRRGVTATMRYTHVGGEKLFADFAVEVAVQIAQRWVLARLRDRRFFSLAELNVAIRVRVDAPRLMRKLGASRRTIDRPP